MTRVLWAPQCWYESNVWRTWHMTRRNIYNCSEQLTSWNVCNSFWILWYAKVMISSSYQLKWTNYSLVSVQNVDGEWRQEHSKKVSEYSREPLPVAFMCVGTGLKVITLLEISWVQDNGIYWYLRFNTRLIEFRAFSTCHIEFVRRQKQYRAGIIFINDMKIWKISILVNVTVFVWLNWNPGTTEKMEVATKNFTYKKSKNVINPINYYRHQIIFI